MMSGTTCSRIPTSRRASSGAKKLWWRAVPPRFISAKLTAPQLFAVSRRFHLNVACFLDGPALPARRATTGRSGARLRVLQPEEIDPRCDGSEQNCRPGVKLKEEIHSGQEQSSHRSPRSASRASLRMIGTIVRAATGSAHHHPSAALRSSPPRRIADRYAHKDVCRESDSSARLSNDAATFLFWRASQGIIASDTPAMTIPMRLGDGGSRRIRLSAAS